MAEPLPKTNRCQKCGEWFHNAHACAADLSIKTQEVPDWMKTTSSGPVGSEFTEGLGGGAPVAWGMPNSAITGSTRWMMLRENLPSNDQYGGALWTPLYDAPQPAERVPLQLSPEEADFMRLELKRSCREVFDAKGPETPQVVRDVIEYADSWLSVYLQKRLDRTAGVKEPGK